MEPEYGGFMPPLGRAIDQYSYSDDQPLSLQDAFAQITQALMQDEVSTADAVQRFQDAIMDEVERLT
jgi:hypothetical protein